MTYYICMLIDWDDKKNEDNQKKHGVSFEEAQSVVTNPLALVAANGHPSGERFEYLGHSQLNQLLYVVTVEKSEVHIRIVSARKATKQEKEAYEERF